MGKTFLQNSLKHPILLVEFKDFIEYMESLFARDQWRTQKRKKGEKVKGKRRKKEAETMKKKKIGEKKRK